VTERERRVFRLSGDRNRKRRWRLYSFMLEHMDDEQRFRTTYYLANEILNGIVEGNLTLPEANAVLQVSSGIENRRD
jgi:condensin-2 complex subunit D3